jgi:hypothetical protein
MGAPCPGANQSIAQKPSPSLDLAKRNTKTGHKEESKDYTDIDLSGSGPINNNV